MPKTVSTQSEHDAALIKSFSKQLLQWHAKHGRHGLPWQGIRDPYAVWVSEIMLQQTQVATVLERYPKMMQRFPSVQHLANAKLDDVLAEWSGLGYYTRARNLHACAQQVVSEHQGQFPSDHIALEGLSGIGRSTAGAIAAFAFLQRTPILDANVKRVLARLFGITEAVSEKAVIDRLWGVAEELLPKSPQQMPVYTQALMDFGATWCTAKQPVCMTQKASCPFEYSCKAKAMEQVLAIPKKAPKKKSPQFQCVVAMLTNGGAVLLQKRPANAIWGGLWSLPESPWQQQGVDQSQLAVDRWDAKQLLNAVLEKRAAGKTPALDAQAVTAGPHIKHVFSHRILQIQTYEMALNAKTKKELDLALQDCAAQFTWAPLHRLDQYGLAQPIRLILENWSRARDAAQLGVRRKTIGAALKSNP